ncbi:MAG: flagellar motor switch protein FliN [Oscillospiraceae bacterium]|nr:flagellar motor switch protein FliN [Oscillospiraceae bacterium]
MSSESVIIDGFGEAERDAIGEIMNITMGSAATAVSNMLSAKVWITTPTVSVEKAKNLVYPELEPSIHVKIKYVVGVSGDNVLVLKQDDVQLILNQLMGMPLEVTDDFEFDEMNISAVCEVMNQMMGSSATALSELINTPIDISTPEAQVSKSSEDSVNPYGIDPEEDVCVIKFKLTIDNVINSEFISVLSIPLATEMANKMMANFTVPDEPEPEPASGGALSQDEINALLGGSSTPAPEPAPAPASGGSMSQEEINALLSGGAAAPAPMPAPDMNMYQQPVQQQMPQMPVQPQMQQMPAQQIPQQQMPLQQPLQGNPYGGGYYMPPYGYPAQPMQPVQRGSAVNVQAVQLQSFENYNNKDLNADQNDNLKLLMGVPLDVTVEIGSARKKVKEILDFTQGTIIELERQAGAPVDIIVNGHLIARGDVVVIDDNFAVRITEIIKSKFLDNLGKE